MIPIDTKVRSKVKDRGVGEIKGLVIPSETCTVWWTGGRITIERYDDLYKDDGIPIEDDNVKKNSKSLNEVFTFPEFRIQSR